MDDKDLQIYQLLYQAYADEIKNLWQRSIFLATFMVLVWTGYGALQLKALDKDFSVSAGYCLVSFGLCGVIIILSLLWIAMAKGSKFVQEAHEEHIASFEFNNAKIKQLFCGLNIYEPKLKNKLSKELFSNGVLKAYRYSPSKINIALGCFSAIIATFLSLVHIFIIMCNFEKLNCTCIVFIIIAFILTILIIMFIVPDFMQKILKGGNKTKD